MIGRAGSRASQSGRRLGSGCGRSGAGRGDPEPVWTRAGLGPPSTAARREELGSGTRQRRREGKPVWLGGVEGSALRPAPRVVAEAGSLETDVRCRGCGAGRARGILFSASGCWKGDWGCSGVVDKEGFGLGEARVSVNEEECIAELEHQSRRK